MKAQQLSGHIARARLAAQRHERHLASSLARAFTVLGDEAAQRFEKHALVAGGNVVNPLRELAAAAQPNWTPPLPDEVMPLDHAASVIDDAIAPARTAALDSFASKLPSCIATNKPPPQGYEHIVPIVAEPLTAAQKTLLTETKWRKPPQPLGIHKGRGGAGGFHTDKMSKSMTDQGRQGEEYFRQLTGGTVIHVTGERSPLDVVFDSMGFEVKTTTVDATKYEATIDDPRSVKEAFAEALGVKGNVAVVIIDRDKSEALIYWREGLKGGKVAESTGWRYMGSVPTRVDLPALTAAAQPCDGLEMSWDVTNPYWGTLYENTGRHITNISQTTRHRVMRTIARGYENGDSVPEVAAAIRETMRSASRGRALTIARTELNRIANGAALVATQIVSREAQIGYQKQWLTAPGAEHPRHEDYDGLDGQTVGLDEEFDVGGDNLQYPGDPDGDPGETINCRCSIEFVEGEYVLSDSEAEAAGVPVGDMQADAVLPFDETSEGDTVEPETTETADMDDQCASCDHAMSSHEDDSGACSVEGCSCEGYEEAAAEAEAETEEASAAFAKGGPLPASIVFNYDNSSVPIVFTTSNTGEGITFVEQPQVPQAEETLPAENPSPAAPPGPAQHAAGEIPWHANLAPEGKATDDGRIFAPGAIGWRDTPLSLMAMTSTSAEGGHDGAELAGRIDSIYRNVDAEPTTLIEADGVFTNTDFGHEIADLVDSGALTGNSVDLAVNSSKICLRSDVVDENGFWLEGLDPDTLEEVDILAVMFGEIPFEDVIFVIIDAVIGMSTVCPFPAFEEGTISLAADGSQRKWAAWEPFPRITRVESEYAIKVVHADDHLTASAAGLAPLVPPREWFEDPELEQVTPLTLTPEGRVYGHAWQWDECHVGMQDSCTVAPRSNTGYSYFLLKEIETEEGPVEVGTITLDTNHAAQRLSWRDAASHYDDTGTAIADVTFGEDAHGGWFSGALRPDVSAEAVRKFRGASLSGDWRRIHGNLELVGLLSCNVAGFPIPRTKALVASGEDGSEVLALVAAGINVGPVEVSEADRAELELLRAQANGDLDELLALAEEAK